MGAPKKPMALRELHGTADRNKQRNNDNAPSPLRGIGPAPEHLPEPYQQVWDEIVGQMYAGVLGEADRLALEAMVRLVVDMRTDYENFTAAKMTQLISLCGRFGMTPSDRTKIVVPKGEKQNTFAAIFNPE
jgi:phage terminase small subunit